MTTLKTLLEKVELNQQAIAEQGKFDDALLKKINYKLRLDWNYYSNRMEGGTLTKAETRSVMVGNIDVKGKPFKDVAEMTGHDKIVLDVLKMSKAELRIAEKRIKEIHKAIMYEEDTEKAQEIGKWKSSPNEIINYKGEKISFSQPRDVADQIHKLIDLTNSELDKFYLGKPSKHPIEIAAQFHIDFVSIHPFYDGNGRTSRVLTNVILMSCGYPAMIVKDEHKQSYYKLLGDIQAYEGKVDLFYTFIAERVLETQQLIIDAMEGKEIDEPDDIDKELALLKRELAREDILKTPASAEIIADTIENSIIPLFEEIERKFIELEDFFFDKKRIFQFKHYNSGTTQEVGTTESTWELIRSKWLNDKIRAENVKIGELTYMYQLRGFKKTAIGHECFTRIEVYFRDYNFSISTDVNHRQAESIPYGKQFSKEEIVGIIRPIFKDIIKNIKSWK